MTAGAPPAQDPRAWIAVSNRHAQVLLDVLARFAPESAGQFGVTGLDEAVSNLSTENRDKRPRRHGGGAGNAAGRAHRRSRTRSSARTSTSSSSRRRPISAAANSFRSGCCLTPT